MPKPKRRLSDLNVREIALCPDGMNPEARIVLYKARDKKPAEVGKQEGEEDEPRTFSDHEQAARLMEIDSAIDRRLHALLATTTEIMRSDVDDKQDRILAAVADYAATMERDVPELFAGRLAKWFNALTAEGRSSDDVVHAIVKSELEVAGLMPDEPSGGRTMDILKSLSDRGKQALAYVLGDRDPADFFKDTTDTVGELVAGLLEKAAETGEQIVVLTTDLEKARKPATDPNSLESILKAIDDPGVRSYIEMQDAAMKKDRGDFAEFRKAARMKELTDIVKGLECLPNEENELVLALQKADDLGVLEPIQKALVSANEQAKAGAMLKELGVETLVGDGAVGTPDEAHEALVAKATEIQKSSPDLTAEQAYEKACERNSDLYKATRGVRQTH